MKKTFEELYTELDKSLLRKYDYCITKNEIIEMCQKVRMKTLEEAERFIKIEDFGYSTNKKELLNLDKNSIEL
jgi:hypothetical protein